ncbi:putative DNA-binding protein [Paenibacillus sp. 1011MAR3C5]|uniref:putative DNA-binding protein n=1 Tax=Paenibacillus sp. 1011MAR3C5 TaxID=1675787 RepID=UPI000E6BF73F|nr:putative DNA-binding protein [Paenibacillus sp. 1011MAR3C5]RJE87070.1 putative DNA-binding protein [Paenibacillus sp. 1011MAR3C5]
MKEHTPDALARTTRVNLLFDFYESLLTDKQRTILTYYYHDDFSLGEIASEFGISRQAVYDNIKRAEGILESYEEKLSLLARHVQLMAMTDKLERDVKAIVTNEWDKQSIIDAIGQFRAAEGTAREGGGSSWQHLKA